MATVHPPPKSSSQAYVPQFSPKHLGYRLPAEWEPHEAVWLAWPHHRPTWGDDQTQVHAAFIELIKTLAVFEKIHLIVPTIDGASDLKSQLKFANCPQNFLLHIMPTNDAWIRDYGAMFVSRLDDATALPKRVGVDWGFNGWGIASIETDSDNAIPPRMAQAVNSPSVSAGMILVGGAVDSNGQGTMLTTESALLDLARNDVSDREWVESKVATMLGVHQTIWLQGGIAHDTTGGRVDQVARFVGPNRIALVVDENKSNTNYEVLRENRRRVADARNASGQPFDIVTLPAPVPFERDGRQLPASYANFYLANGSVLVPQYGFPTDRTALSTIQSLFPARRAIGIDCRMLVQPQGSLHGLTQQVPAFRADHFFS